MGKTLEKNSSVPKTEKKIISFKNRKIHMKVVLCYSSGTSLYNFIYFHFLNFGAA